MAEVLTSGACTSISSTNSDPPGEYRTSGGRTKQVFTFDDIKQQPSPVPSSTRPISPDATESRIHLREEVELRVVPSNSSPLPKQGHSIYCSAPIDSNTPQILRSDANRIDTPLSSTSKNPPSLQPTQSAAAKLSQMQVKFAETTAIEMKQIIDWYATNGTPKVVDEIIGGSNNFTTSHTSTIMQHIPQSQCLPNNAFVSSSFDTEEANSIVDYESIRPEFPEHSAHQCSPRSSFTSSLQSPKLAGFRKSSVKRYDSFSEPSPGATSVSSSSDDADTISSTQSFDSSHYYHSEAQKQTEEVDYLLQKTQDMSRILSEYAQIPISPASSTGSTTSIGTISSTLSAPSRERLQNIRRRRQASTEPKRRVVKLKKLARTFVRLCMLMIMTYTVWQHNRSFILGSLENLRTSIVMDLDLTFQSIASGHFTGFYTLYNIMQTTSQWYQEFESTSYPMLQGIVQHLEL